MAYPLEFAGELRFASNEALARGLAALASQPSLVARDQLSVDGLTLRLQFSTYGPATTYYETSAALSALAEHASSGSLEARLGADDEVEVETIPAASG